MNEKNEQDIFKNLIDSIHVDEDTDPEKEPVQVTVRQSGTARISDRPAQENAVSFGITAWGFRECGGNQTRAKCPRGQPAARAFDRYSAIIRTFPQAAQNLPPPPPCVTPDEDLCVLLPSCLGFSVRVTCR